MVLNSSAKKINSERHKRFLLRRLLSSFMVTSGVVVAFVIFKPTPATAHFIDIRALGNTIYYEVTVFDEDSVIREGSLKIVAENPLESHSITLEVGVQSGVFESLSLDTNYRVSVKANEGFGEKTLTTTRLKTSSGLGGVVASQQIINTEDYEFSYELTTRLYDPYNDIAEAFLTVYHESEYIQTTEPIAVFFVATGIQVHVLDGISDEGGNLVIVFEAILHSEQRVVLDQLTVKIPSPIYASIYPSDVSAHAIHLSVYLDQRYDTMAYALYLYENLTLVRTITLTYTDETIILQNLKEATKYHIELWALTTDLEEFENAKTLVSSTIVKTTNVYHITYDVSSDPQSISVRIELSDPLDVITQMRLHYYTLEAGIETYQGTYAFIFHHEDNQKVAETVLPNIGNYILRFYADKQAGEDFFYPWMEVHQIRNEEEINHG